MVLNSNFVIHEFHFLLFSMLVVATSGTGFVLGSGNAVDFGGLCWTCAGTMMVAASANSLNQVCSALLWTNIIWSCSCYQNVIPTLKNAYLPAFIVASFP